MWILTKQSYKKIFYVSILEIIIVSAPLDNQKIFLSYDLDYNLSIF
jgi:hypothetical protein